MLALQGAPARVIRAWIEGRFELVVSPQLLDELERALAYPKLRSRIPQEEAEGFIQWLGRSAVQASDPTDGPPVHSPDPGDDYLIALAAAERAVLVSGDEHLLSLDVELPIYAPREFLDILDSA